MTDQLSKSLREHITAMARIVGGSRTHLQDTEALAAFGEECACLALQASADLPRSLEGLEGLIQQWRERARRVRPLEDAPISAEKRARMTEYIWFTNRANELEAALRQTAESRTSPVSSPPAPKGP